MSGWYKILNLFLTRSLALLALVVLSILSLQCCSIAVWGRSSGNVPHWESETLLHCYEKTGPEETSKSDKATSESISCSFLWYFCLPEVWDCHFCLDIPEHGEHGNRAFWSVPSGNLCSGDLQCSVYNNLQFRWVISRVLTGSCQQRQFDNLSVITLQRPQWR